MPQVSRLKIQIYGNETQCPVNIMDTMDFAQLFDDDRMNQDKSEKESDKPSKKEKESDGESEKEGDGESEKEGDGELYVYTYMYCTVQGHCHNLGL